MKYRNLQETQGAKWEYTRIKLVVGTVLSLLFLAVIASIGYQSFQRILVSMNELSKPRKETRLVQELVSGLSELQNSAGMYAVTMSSSDLDEYVRQRKAVRLGIDSLRWSLGRKDYFEKVDSLHYLFNQYTRSLNEWLIARSANPTGAMNRLRETLEEGDSSLASLDHIPKSEITTITTTVEKTVVEDRAVDKEQKEKSKSFLRRFFGGSKSDKEEDKQVKAPKETIRKQVVTETMVKADTGYYHQVDTLLDKMKASIRQAELAKQKYNRQLKESAIQLMHHNLVLIQKVNTLLKSIEREEQLLAGQQLALSQRNAQASYRQLFLLCIAGGLFALLFVVLLFRDISKNMQYKRLLQETTAEARRLARVKEEFLANMSHEIRTPLNSIIGFTDQWSARGTDQRQLPPVGVLEKASHHLLQLVNDILDYSKIESGNMPLEQIGFTAERVAREVMAVLTPEAQRKGLLLSYHPGPGVHEILRGDPVRLKQILLNLIGNGIKFTDRGKVALSMQVFIEEGGSYLLEIEVEDTGIGIAPAQVQQVFDVFSQGDTSVSRKYGGTGLGLTITKRLIDLHKGKIDVKSEPGAGTVFRVCIPYLSAESDEYFRQQEFGYAVSSELKGKSILVVDDDESSHVLLKPVLQQWQMHAVFCLDAEKAWALLQQRNFDVLLVDLHLPVVDGKELLARLRAWGQCKGMKRILCTAHVLTHDDPFVSSVDAVLYKPYHYTRLWNTLSQVFGLTGQEAVAAPLPERTEEREVSYSLHNVWVYAGGDAVQLEQFIQTFIACSRGDLLSIEEGLRQGDLMQVGELAHKLKNMCGQLEAKEVLEILYSLECLVDESPMEVAEAEKLAGQLNEKLNRLLRELEQEMCFLKDQNSSL